MLMWKSRASQSAVFCRRLPSPRPNLTQTKKIPLKFEELRTTPLPWGRRGHDNPQLIFATGIPPRKNEPNTTRIAGKVVFVGCEWRSAATLFESASYDKHLVNPMHLQEMLG
jgi:hypothetical protein